MRTSYPTVLVGWLGGGAVSPCLMSMNACHPNMGVPRRGESAPRMALCVRICTRCVDHASYKTCSALYCVRRAVRMGHSLLRTHLLPLSPPVCRVCPVTAGSSSYAAVTNTQTSRLNENVTTGGTTPWISLQATSISSSYMIRKKSKY